MYFGPINHDASPKDVFERAHPLAYPRPQASAKRAAARQGGKVCIRMATANVLTLHAGPRPRGCRSVP
eukprot:7143492-Alexandrium_andersonii.AAC.1